jgi:hypothetical protein
MSTTDSDKKTDLALGYAAWWLLPPAVVGATVRGVHAAVVGERR